MKSHGADSADFQSVYIEGFLRIKRRYPNSQVPHKASKYHQLTAEQKEYNRHLASQRTIVEHRNRECKIFRICSTRYRGKPKNYEKTWKLVSAIVNLKLSTRQLNDATL